MMVGMRTMNLPHVGTALVLAVVAALAGCSIRHRDLTLEVDAAPASPDANVAAPTCAITMPGPGTSVAFDVEVKLAASATDPKDGPLTGAAIVWRSNLQSTPLGTGTTLGTRLPPGMNVVTCTATDSAGLTGMGSLEVLSRSPFAQINHPGNNETRSATVPVPFVGVARDLVDGSLSGGSLKWTSSRDGAIGTGGNFTRTLSVGVHTITLTATDSTNRTDTATITLTMTP